MDLNGLKPVFSGFYGTLKILITKRMTDFLNIIGSYWFMALLLCTEFGSVNLITTELPRIFSEKWN